MRNRLPAIALLFVASLAAQYVPPGGGSGSITGGTCTNQAATAISISGVPTCTTITSAYVDTSIVSLTGSQTVTNKTLTTPIIGQINDANGNASIINTATASAVDQFTLANSATGAHSIIASATGSDTNISMQFLPKGTGTVSFGAALTLPTSPLTAVIYDNVNKSGLTISGNSVYGGTATEGVSLGLAFNATNQRRFFIAPSTAALTSSGQGWIFFTDSGEKRLFYGNLDSSSAAATSIFGYAASGTAQIDGATIALNTSGNIVMGSGGGSVVRFGANTTGFPALVSSGPLLKVRLADNSADAAMNMSTATMTAIPASAGASGLFVCVDSVGVLYKKATCP